MRFRTRFKIVSNKDKLHCKRRRIMKEFINKWSNWWILNPKRKKLDYAFEKELKELIEEALKKEIQEKEIIITNMQARGKRVTIRIKKEDVQNIGIVEEKYLIISAEYAKIEEFTNELKIRIKEIEL